MHPGPRLALLLFAALVLASPVQAEGQEAPVKRTERTGQITPNFLDGVSPQAKIKLRPRSAPAVTKAAPATKLLPSPKGNSDPIGRIIAQRSRPEE